MTDNETTPPVDTPIVVNGPGSEQLGQAARTFLIACGGYLAAKGWVDPGIVAATIPLLLIIGPFLWGQYRVLKTNAQRKTMAGHLPDSIATVGDKL